MTQDQLFDLRTYLDEEVLQAYRNFQPEARERWADTKDEKSKLGLDNTTARALSTGMRGERGPIKLYKLWAEDRLRHVTTDVNLVATLGTAEGFERWHSILAETLVVHWRNSVAQNNELLQHDEGDDFIPVNSELSVAHRYKMVDLFVRYLRVKGNEYPELVRHCLEFGHLPLDRKSLAVLSAAFSGISVGEAFTMGDIANEAMYRTQQRLARAVCERAGGSPLLLDIFSLKSEFADALYKKRPDAPSRKKRRNSK